LKGDTVNIILKSSFFTKIVEEWEESKICESKCGVTEARQPSVSDGLFQKGFK
jgi:hypothetical protein